VTQSEVAKRLAPIKKMSFAGDFDPASRPAGSLYFVPDDTLLGSEAERLGIHGEHDLFGGVVPHRFIATKTITHPLLHADSYAPEGWTHRFGAEVCDLVLPGFSAFSLTDALGAGMQLLDRGTVRIKPAGGSGGLGQLTVADAAQLQDALRSLDGDAITRDGLVVEPNLEAAETFSVGQLRVADLLVSYCGSQHLTLNRHGEQVYGGSELVVVRGDFATLLELPLSKSLRNAIAQARAFDDAVLACYDGTFASRRNYDIAQGMDNDGDDCSGVLEQSWRIGGASPAEVLALEAFQAESRLDAVRASTTEIYELFVPPPDAFVFFRDVDPHVGPLTKFAQLRPYGDP